MFQCLVVLAVTIAWIQAGTAQVDDIAQTVPVQVVEGLHSRIVAGQASSQTKVEDEHLDTLDECSLATVGTSPKETDLPQVLQTALDTNQVATTLQSLLLPHPGYTRLRQALVQYRHIGALGGWLPVPKGAKMQKGDSSDRVAALRTRLLVTEDLDHKPPHESNLFDEALVQAVRRFQQRHGLDVDGIVGPTTLAALNVPVEARVRQIELNLERWLPHDLGPRYLLVNIANFILEVVENGQSVLTLRIAVGQPTWATPVFSAAISHLVLNPYWNVPSSIAVKEMLPKIRKDSRYLAKRHLTVLQGQGSETRSSNPRTINWSKVPAKNFPYRFRQKPGPENAMGSVKFVLPNSFGVFLHDTPHRELFTKTVRTFSHGCIRIEKPIELAEHLLREDAKWTRDAILSTIDQGSTQTVWLPEPIAIHLVYWTAWVDQEGAVQFRPDIYGRDRLLGEALLEPLPLS